VLLERVEVEGGRGRRGREVGRLEWRSVGLRGRRGVKVVKVEACGELNPVEDGRGVAGCLDPDLEASGKQAMSPVARPVVLHSKPSLSSSSFSRRQARRNESVLPL